MNFHIGQRVRIVTSYGSNGGKEGVIARRGEIFDWIVHIPGTYLRPDLAPVLMADEWPFNSNQLAPLTDPGCTKFLESLKQPTPLVVLARVLDSGKVSA